MPVCSYGQWLSMVTLKACLNEVNPKFAQADDKVDGICHSQIPSAWSSAGVLWYLKLNANFLGLLSALQPFSHPLTQLPLIIGLPCETYSQVSPGKLSLSPFQAGYIEISCLGNSSLEQTPPYLRVPIYKPG